MRRAVDLAKQGLGKTYPNPAVGAVIVKEGKVIGEGFHPKAGMPHAEVYALRAAGERLLRLLSESELAQLRCHGFCQHKGL